MKKLTAIILCITCLFSLCFIGEGQIFDSVIPSAEADTFTEGNFEYEVNNGEATITGTTAEPSGAVTIPAKIGGYPVTGIGEYVFYEFGRLTSITIPTSVTSIGDGAFYGCSGLTSITIPKSVTSIGMEAFCGCSGLTSITIPTSVTTIGESVFSRCTGLTSITIPKSVTSIGNWAFNYCIGLKSITIPSGVTSLGEFAFRGCSGLTSITIPNNVTSIGDGAFEYCTGLTSIIIPNGVTSIDDYMFCDCSGLTSITIPNSVTSIGEEAFEECTGLTSITIPNGVTTIGEGAFEGCDIRIKFNGDKPEGIEGIFCDWDDEEEHNAEILYPCNNSTWKTLKISDFDFGISECEVTLTLSHNIVKIPAKAATYSAAGNTAHYKCTGCKALYKDSKGTVKTTLSAVTIPKLAAQPNAIGYLDYIGNVTLSSTAFTYNNSAKKPTVTVKNTSGKVITNGTSYTVKYCCASGCKSVGTHKVTITGKGNYTGTVTKTFTIKKDLTAGTATLSCTSYTYNAAVKKPTVTVKNSAGTVITKGSSYTVAYCCSSGCKTPGTHTVTITGIGNYAGTIKKTFTINKQQIISARVTLSGTSFTYNGAVKKPTATVKTIQGTTLTKGSSYKLTYCCSAGCKTPGTHTVTITGMGNYTGTVKKTFTINKQQIISARVTLSGTSFTYNGAVKKPTVTVKTVQGTTLTNGSSYKVTYCCSGGCKTKGTHKVTVTAIGSNYTGTVTKTFTIK